MSASCHHLAKAYLQCRMDKGLMAKEDLNNLGFAKRMLHQYIIFILDYYTQIAANSLYFAYWFINKSSFLDFNILYFYFYQFLYAPNSPIIFQLLFSHYPFTLLYLLSSHYCYIQFHFP